MTPLSYTSTVYQHIECQQRMSATACRAQVRGSPPPGLPSQGCPRRGGGGGRAVREVAKSLACVGASFMIIVCFDYCHMCKQSPDTHDECTGDARRVTRLNDFCGASHDKGVVCQMQPVHRQHSHQASGVNVSTTVTRTTTQQPASHTFRTRLTPPNSR